MPFIQNKFSQLGLADFLISILPSVVKRLIYRYKGMNIGKNVYFGFGSIIKVNLECEIGYGSRFGFFTVIVADKLVVKDQVSVGSFSVIKSYELYFGDYSSVDYSVRITPGRYTKRSKFILGENSSVFRNTLINCSLPVEIGCRTGIGGNSFLFTHAYWSDYLKGSPRVHGPIIIGDDCWIAWHTFIHPNTKIDSGSIASATAVLSGNYAENTLIGNAPSRPIPNPYKEPLSLDDRVNRLYEIISEFNYLFEENGGITDGKAYFVENQLVCEIQVVSDKEWTIDKQELNLGNCYIFLVAPDCLDYRFCLENFIDYPNYIYKASDPLFQDFIIFLTSYGIRLKQLNGTSRN